MLQINNATNFIEFQLKKIYIFFIKLLMHYLLTFSLLKYNDLFIKYSIQWRNMPLFHVDARLIMIETMSLINRISNDTSVYLVHTRPHASSMCLNQNFVFWNWSSRLVLDKGILFPVGQMA